MIRKNIDNLDGVSKHLDKGVHRADDIQTGLSKATNKQKWLDDLKDGVNRNGRDAEYVNPNGKVLKWTDQSPADIDNSIQSKLASSNTGDLAEGKVGNFLKSEGKELDGFGVTIKRADNSHATDLDVVTKNEIIEVKNSITAAKDKFVLSKTNGEVGQAGRLVNKNADDFINPHSKKPILYIDQPLPRDASGNLFPSDQAYINALKADGIEVVNSLDELKNIIQ